MPRLYGFTGRDYNAQMFGSFLDGTKHAIEMACLANMSGLVPDVRGMHFPASDLRQIPDILCHQSEGGLLNEEGVVEAVSIIDENEQAVERGLRGGLYCVVDGATSFAMESLGSYGEIIGMIIGQRSGYGMIYRPQQLGRPRNAHQRGAHRPRRPDIGAPHRPLRRSCDRGQKAPRRWHCARRRGRLLRVRSVGKSHARPLWQPTAP